MNLTVMAHVTSSLNHFCQSEEAFKRSMDPKGRRLIYIHGGDPGTDWRICYNAQYQVSTGLYFSAFLCSFSKIDLIFVKCYIDFFSDSFSLILFSFFPSNECSFPFLIFI